MSFRKIIIVTALFLSFSKGTAQKFEMGKVSIAELQEKEHPKDPSAAAAILFEKGKITYEYSQSEGFDMVTTVSARIKIYKKEGYEWANKAIRYYIGSNAREKISFSDVATYNLVNGKIEKTKLKSDGEFDSNLNRYYAEKKIALPNVKEGSVIEYEYRILSPRIGKFRDWNFQSSIPVNYSEFKTYIPEYFIYNATQRGFIFPKVSVERNNKTVNYTYRDGNTPGETIIHSASQETLEYTETQTTYLAENMPALKDESFVNNIKNYTSGIAHELSVVKYPNAPIKSLSSDWESVVKTIYDDEDFGAELKKTGYFESDINALMSGEKSRDELIGAIFNYVKSNMKWNDYLGYSCDDGVKKAYKDKIGNVAEINLMLTAMLRYAGIDANPVLVSTRSNGVALFPNLTAFNYVIAAVEVTDGLILLDATEKFSLPNVLPLRDLNWYGRLIRKDGSSTQVNLMPKALSKENIYMNIVVKNDGSIDGKIRKQLSGHEALVSRKKIVGVNKDAYLEELENKNNAIEISEYVRDNELDLLKPIMETYSFKDTKSVEIINDKIYLSPFLFLSDSSNPFQQEKREYPIDYGYPSEDKFNISIEIPEGYKVESLPKPINIATGDNIGAFKYNIGVNENKIQLLATSSINEAIVPADYYEVLKDFYQRMIDKQNEKIILIKI
jgi:transglutaminase-like putative cysteine protease